MTSGICNYQGDSRYDMHCFAIELVNSYFDAIVEFSVGAGIIQAMRLCASGIVPTGTLIIESCYSGAD